MEVHACSSGRLGRTAAARAPAAAGTRRRAAVAAPPASERRQWWLHAAGRAGTCQRRGAAALAAAPCGRPAAVRQGCKGGSGRWGARGDWRLSPLQILCTAQRCKHASSARRPWSRCHVARCQHFYATARPDQSARPVIEQQSEGMDTRPRLCDCWLPPPAALPAPGRTPSGTSIAAAWAQPSARDYSVARASKSTMRAAKNGGCAVVTSMAGDNGQRAPHARAQALGQWVSGEENAFHIARRGARSSVGIVGSQGIAGMV